MPASEPKEFNNKILFCDVIGYSKRDPIQQGHIQAVLNRAVGHIIQRLETPLEDRLIALPTGDGMVLNFLVSDPDIHLRAALILLERLAAESGNLSIGLRVGLNTDVDQWLIDINGKRNVVGRGINTAQRVMDLGGHAQVMMNDKLRTAFAVYPHYQDKMVHIGRFRVKHDEELEIAQFVDPERSFLSSQLVERRAAPAAPLNLSDILNKRSAGGILDLQLDGGAKGSLSMVEAYVADYLDTLESLQSFRIAASWIVRELLDNAFVHGGMTEGDVVRLRLDRTPGGIHIAVEQPDVPQFDLSQHLRASVDEPSFLRMMHGAGLDWGHSRSQGRMQISAELPKSYCAPVRPIEPVMPAIAAEARRSVAPFPRVDEINWAEFGDWLGREVRAASDAGGPLIVDFGGVDYMSSRGLRALTFAKREAGATEIMFTGVGGRLAQIFAISRYDKIFKLLPDG